MFTNKHVLPEKLWIRTKVYPETKVSEQVGCRERGDSIRWALEDEEAVEVVDAVVVASVEGAAEVQLKYNT